MKTFDAAALEAGTLPIEFIGCSSITDTNLMSGKNAWGEADENFNKFAPHLKDIEVPSDTLQSILDRNRIEHIDAFLVDCEGADWIVFEQLDIERYRPGIIKVEVGALPAAEIGEVLVKLKTAGYQVGIYAEDVWAFALEPTSARNSEPCARCAARRGTTRRLRRKLLPCLSQTGCNRAAAPPYSLPAIPLRSSGQWQSFRKRRRSSSSGWAASSGASVAHHLIERGWDDIVGIDKSGIPTDIGSTAHASDFCYTTSHDFLSCWTTLYSIDFYEKMGHYERIGGLEVARVGDDARMDEIKRKIASAKAFGTRARLIEPGRDQGEVPADRGEHGAGRPVGSRCRPRHPALADGRRQAGRPGARPPASSRPSPTRRPNRWSSRTAASRAWSPIAAPSRPTTSWSAPACGAG